MNQKDKDTATDTVTLDFRSIINFLIREFGNNLELVSHSKELSEEEKETNMVCGMLERALVVGKLTYFLPCSTNTIDRFPKRKKINSWIYHLYLYRYAGIGLALRRKKK